MDDGIISFKVQKMIFCFVEIEDSNTPMVSFCVQW